MICVCCFLSLSEEGDVLQRIRQFLTFEQSDLTVYNCNILLIVWLISVLIQGKHVILALVRLGKINYLNFVYEKIVIFFSFVLLLVIFSQILTEYIGIEPKVSVCLSVCVCVSVCLSVCVISTAKRISRF